MLKTHNHRNHIGHNCELGKHNHKEHSHASNKTALRNSFLMISAFMLVEIAGGFATNSLALLSDAGHMLSDAAALGLSLFAFKFGERKANLQKTFGYKKPK